MSCVISPYTLLHRATTVLCDIRRGNNMVDILVPREAHHSRQIGIGLSNSDEFHLDIEGTSYTKDSVQMGAQINVSYHKDGMQFGQSDEAVARAARTGIADIVSKSMASEVYQASFDEPTRLRMETELTLQIDKMLKSAHLTADDVEITGIKADDGYVKIVRDADEARAAIGPAQEKFDDAVAAAKRANAEFEARSVLMKATREFERQSSELAAILRLRQ